MAGPRQPIDLIVAKGQKHISKADIEERRRREIQPSTDDVTAPAYLTPKQKKHFDKLASQLEKINIMGETDTDTLARYVVAEYHYEKAVKALQRLKPPAETGDYTEDAERMALHIKNEEALSKVQDRYFKQAHTAASALGLTISSRCKLSVPVKDEPERANKFSKFGGLQ